MPRKIKLVLAYDGTAFHGWQRQPGQRTAQGAVEDVARRILRHPLAVVGASRTDAGVHARGQVAHIATETAIPIENLRRALDHALPDDVAIVHARFVPDDFHAGRSALGKLYRYRIHASAQKPATRPSIGSAWHCWHPLDPARMHAAAQRLVGTHDFAAFACSGDERENTVRTIERLEAARGDEIVIDVAGDGFLYHQVRNMVGTLAEIGRGLWTVERIDEILASRDRRCAGPTAPACGLCLEWIRYAPSPREPQGAQE